MAVNAISSSILKILRIFPLAKEKSDFLGNIAKTILTTPKVGR